jgi:DNA-binding GntR family transcriptional regulator
LFARAGARLVERVAELWDHAERYRLLHPQHSGELTHHIRLVQAGHAWILKAAEQRDAVLAAKRTAEHLARTALMTLIHIDQRNEPARVRGARACLRRGSHR